MSNLPGVEASAPQVTIQAQWVLNQADVPPTANQILLQPSAPLASGKVDGAYVTIGHLNPPIINGAPGQLTTEVAANTIFPVTPVARFLVSTERLADFRDAITTYIETMESAEA